MILSWAAIYKNVLNKQNKLNLSCIFQQTSAAKIKQKS